MIACTTNVLFSAIIGSRAYGFSTDESDIDQRSVFACPTRELLRIGDNGTRSIRTWDDYLEQVLDLPKNDSPDISMEIGHFLTLALKANPVALEYLKCPCTSAGSLGLELRKLFPAFLSKDRVANAFSAYAQSQRHGINFVNNVSDKRNTKLKVAAIRMMWHGYELLATGDMNIDLAASEIGPTIAVIRMGNMSNEATSEVLNALAHRLWEARETTSLPDRPDYDRVNEFLLKVRQTHWA